MTKLANPLDPMASRLHALNSAYHRMYSQIHDAVGEPDMNGLYFSDYGSVVATKFKGVDYGETDGYRYEKADKKNSLYLAWCLEWTEYFLAESARKWDDPKIPVPSDENSHMCPTMIERAIAEIKVAAAAEQRERDAQGELSWEESQMAKVIPLPTKRT